MRPSANSAAQHPPATVLTATDSPAPGTFDKIFALLDAETRPVTGPAKPRLLVIPIHDDGAAICGGLWSFTMFRWLHIQAVFIPPCIRGRGAGSALLATAEAVARERGCIGSHVDGFSFQAAPFYHKRGYIQFGVLPDYPPGHTRHFFYKRLRPVLTAEPKDQLCAV